MRRIQLLLLGICVILLFGLSAPDRVRNSETGQEIVIQPRVAHEDEPYIKVGFFASLTGSASLLGQMGQMGCRLAVEEINCAGGINGKEIRLIEYDDQTDPGTAVSVVRKMLEEDCVDAIIGSHTTGNVIQTVPLTEQAQVLQISLGTSYIWTNAGYRYLFRASGNSRNYDNAILASIKADGHQRIAIYHCSTEYAEAGAKYLISRIREDPDMKLVWHRNNNITQTNFTQDFLSMCETEPDAVILYASSENAGTQLQQLRESIGYTGAVYGPEAFSNSSSRQEAGSSVTGLVFACTNAIPPSPAEAFSVVEREFLEAFIRMYGTMPTAQAAYRGYDALMILAETFRNAESFESEDLRGALLGITNYEGVCGTYDFSNGSGDGLQGCQIVTMTGPNTMDIQTFAAKPKSK